MKVLLFYAHGGFPPISPPLGILHLDAMLKSQGISSKVFCLSNMFDCLNSKESFDAKINEIIDNEISDETLFCGFSVMTGPQINASLYISHLIKNRKPFVKIVWGGVHPTLMPEQTIQNPFIDIVCKGEFEEGIIRLVNDLEKGGLEKGIYSESIQFDLNNLPLLHYENFDLNSFQIQVMNPFYKFTTPKVATVELTRGCPLSCYYCVQNNMRTKFRYMSTENVIKHLKHIKSFGFEALIVADDNFYISPIATEVLEAIKKENLGLQIYISIPVTKAINMQTEDFQLLHDAGVVTLGISVESGSDRMLKIMGKKHTVDMALEVNRRLSEHDFISNYNFIAGFPEEKIEDVKATFEVMINLLKENPGASVNIKKLIPTPNTEVYRRCISQGMQEPILELWHKMVDLEWNGDYIYVDSDVQSWYKKMKPFISSLTEFCAKRTTVFQNKTLEHLLIEYCP